MSLDISRAHIDSIKTTLFDLQKREGVDPASFWKSVLDLATNQVEQLKTTPGAVQNTYHSSVQDVLSGGGLDCDPSLLEANAHVLEAMKPFSMKVVLDPTNLVGAIKERLSKNNLGDIPVVPVDYDGVTPDNSAPYFLLVGEKGKNQIIYVVGSRRSTEMYYKLFGERVWNKFDLLTKDNIKPAVVRISGGDIQVIQEGEITTTQDQFRK